MNIHEFDHEFTEEDFLKGPLLKTVRHPKSLETFDEHWRPGAQAFGFRDAAFVLIMYVEQSPGRYGTTLLHPIMFTFRHSIELRLKALLERYDEKWPTHHEIARLWSEVKKVARRYGVEGELRDMDRAMKELHNLDPIGETFRYSLGSQGQPSPLPATEIDIRHLHLQMRAMDIAMSGLETMLDEASQNLTA